MLRAIINTARAIVFGTLVLAVVGVFIARGEGLQWTLDTIRAVVTR